MSTPTHLNYLRNVQAVLKSLDHDIKLDQHEYQLVMAAMWSHLEASDCARDIIADRGMGAA